MEKKTKTKLYFIIATIIIFFSGVMALAFQTNFGSVDVQQVAITDANGDKIVGKLYRPINVDGANPAPGILGLHGYNNDKDVQRPASLELARAGFVVLAIDELGHGDSEGSVTFGTEGSQEA
ncbi:MAG: CocE/NonD family hydrolase [Candidatus Lokiarchaeota archaeon]|jgi:cephalosporin-C deacetylase-like acetyl esterase